MEQKKTTEPELGRRVAIRGVIELAIAQMRASYGTGGSDPRQYHNEVRTQRVIDDANLIADRAIESGTIVPADKELIHVAAAYHDVVQHLGRGLNEEASAQMAQKVMYEFPDIFTPEDRAKVARVIESTTPKDDLVDRHVTPGDHLVEVLADAEFAFLGSEWGVFWNSTMALFHELKTDDEKRKRKYPSPEPINVVEVARFGFQLIKGHRFYTPEAEKLFPNKGRNLERLQQLAA